MMLRIESTGGHAADHLLIIQLFESRGSGGCWSQWASCVSAVEQYIFVKKSAQSQETNLTRRHLLFPLTPNLLLCVT